MGASGRRAACGRPREAEAIAWGTSGRCDGAGMTTKPRTDLLTTMELYQLDQACELVSRAFGTHPYLVGSAGIGNDGTAYRDVDVRLMLSDADFAAACPTRERWELLSLVIGAYLRERTGLPVDFQIQRTREANERYPGGRNPLGTGRVFAGGGDGTPDWKTFDPAVKLDF